MNNKKIILLIIVLAITLGILHYSMNDRPTDENIQKYAWFISNATKWQGKFAPNVQLEMLNGEKFNFADHIGKQVIVLNFFATWCEPCLKEMPELNRYYEANKGKDFILIGINADELVEEVRKFINEKNIRFPIAIDKGDVLQQKYGITSYPTTIVIGVDGKVALYEIGAISNARITFDKLYKKNKSLLAKGTGIDNPTYITHAAKEKYSDVIDKRYQDVVLEGRARDFARKFYYCTIYRDRPLLNCHCYMCRKMKRKLSLMQLDNKSDDEILKELFLVPPKPRITNNDDD
ncbi:MAG: redoxin domain-containing protein [bacterium]